MVVPGYCAQDDKINKALDTNNQRPVFRASCPAGQLNVLTDFIGSIPIKSYGCINKPAFLTALSTASTLCGTPYDFSSVRALNIAPTMPAHSSVTKDMRDTTFRRLVTKAGETCELS